MTKKTLSRCLTTIGMLAFAISMALPAAALEDRALPTYPCPKCGTTMTTSVETGYEFFTTPCIHGNVNARDQKCFEVSYTYADCPECGTRSMMNRNQIRDLGDDNNETKMDSNYFYYLLWNGNAFACSCTRKRQNLGRDK